MWMLRHEGCDGAKLCVHKPVRLFERAVQRKSVRLVRSGNIIPRILQRSCYVGARSRLSARQNGLVQVSRFNVVNGSVGLTRARLMTEVVAHRCYIMDVHTEFAKTDQFLSDSVPRLLLSVIGDHIPLDHNELGLYRAQTSSMFTFWESPVPLDCRSYLCHLLPYESCFPEIMEMINSIGGLEELASNLWFDRSLLVMMSYSRPWLGHLVSLLTRGKEKLGPAFSFDTVLREMRERHGILKLDALIGYLTTYGHPDTIRRLVLEGFDAATMIMPAAARADDQILDCLLDKDTKWSSTEYVGQAVHLRHIADRICKDSAFKAKLIDIFAFKFSDNIYDEVALTNSECSPLAELLADSTMRNVSQTKTGEIPLYVSLLIDGCISRYESRNFSFPGDLRSFVCNVSQDLIYSRLPETHRQSCQKGRVLQRLLSTECFRSGIDYIPKERPSDRSKLSRDTLGFTPLMVALDIGMVSTVKILLDAGAQITGRSSSGISAFQLAERNAQGDHPRVVYQYRRAKYGKFAVSEDIDEAMLKLLRETLRNRGEEVPRKTLRSRGEEVPVPKIPDIGIEQPLQSFHRAYRKSINYHSLLRILKLHAGKFQEWIKILLSWLLKPAADITWESLSERFEYFAIVWVVAFGLSMIKLLQPTAQWIATVGLRQFSRPVFLVPIMAWVIMTIWRYYVTEL